MLEKVLRSVLGLGGASLLCVALLTNPAPVTATINPSDAEVFTGRFIPAFLGNAYDPEVAYQELAGMPVYVFAFDFWQGGGGGSSWIISDLAVKTQIRIDGSFQVQGLPTASHYGVYFPFKLNSTDMTVSRVDCTDASGGSPDNYTGAPSNPTNPCRGQEREWDFRMPEQEDKLIDVFSYSAEYLNTPAVVESQVDTGSGLEKVAIQHAFVTNRKVLDIENNINTFPLVPNTTLRVQLDVGLTSIETGVEYEVYAVRLSKPDSGDSITPLLNFPVIRGRAGRMGESKRLFQVYAPEGDYAVTVWRRDPNSPSYQDWDGQSSLNSEKTGWAQIWVRRGKEIISGESLESSDWQSMLNRTDEIKIYNNPLIIWGTVVNKDGYLMTSKSSLPNATVQVKSTLNDKDREFPYLFVHSVYDNSTPPSQNDMFVSPSGMVGLPPDNDYGDYKDKGGWAVRGVYVASYPYGVAGTGSRASFGDSILAVAGEKATEYVTVGRSTGLFYNTRGPLRHNLETEQCSSSCYEGYEKGITLKIYAPDSENEVYASGAKVTVRLDDSGMEEEDWVLAERKLYIANPVGVVNIPPADLRLGSGKSGAEGYEGNNYLVSVEYKNSLHYQWVGYSAGHPGGGCITTWDNGHAYVSVDKDNNCWRQSVSPVRAQYNLAFLNKFDRLFSPQTALAQEDEMVTVEVAFNKFQPQKETPEGGGAAEINAHLSYVNRFGPDLPCPDCYITRGRDEGKSDGISNIAGVDNFYVHVPLPMSAQAKESYCRSEGGATLMACESFSARNQQTYQLAVTGPVDGVVTTTKVHFTVNDDGSTNPVPPIVLPYGQNCATYGARVIRDASQSQKGWLGGLLPDIGQSVSAHVTGWMAHATCATANFIGEKSGAVLTLIHDYGLRTRALTQDQGVLEVYGIIRNLVNVFFVVIFVVVALMTILRYQPEQWHISVLLPKLLIGLVLANFSVLFVQALLDVNNFATDTLFRFVMGVIKDITAPDGSAPAAGVAVSAIALVGYFGTAIGSMIQGAVGLLAGTSLPMIVPVLVGVGLALLLLFFQILRLLFLLLMRYAILWLLTIVAPLVFAASVLPWFSDLRSVWFGLVIKVSSVQTIVALVLTVGVLLITIGSAGAEGVFSALATALLGVLIFMMAFKIPVQMLSSLEMLGIKSPDIGGGEGLGGTARGLAKAMENRRLGRERRLGFEERKAEGEGYEQMSRGKKLRYQAGRFARAMPGVGGLLEYTQRELPKKMGKAKTEGKKEADIISHGQWQASFNAAVAQQPDWRGWVSGEEMTFKEQYVINVGMLEDLRGLYENTDESDTTKIPGTDGLTLGDLHREVSTFNQFKTLMERIGQENRGVFNWLRREGAILRGAGIPQAEEVEEGPTAEGGEEGEEE